MGLAVVCVHVLRRCKLEHRARGIIWPGHAKGSKPMTAGSSARKFVRQILNRTGKPADQPIQAPPPPGPVFPPDFDQRFLKDIEAVAPFTMTHQERMFHLTKAVEYIHRNSIPGAVVECGVWRGGSMMLVARVLKA